MEGNKHSMESECDKERDWARKEKKREREAETEGREKSNNNNTHASYTKIGIMVKGLKWLFSAVFIVK